MNANPHGPDGWGDPCRECGYGWSITEADALAAIAGAPRAFADLLDGRDGTGRPDDLVWDARSYVWHVADNLRVWAERLSGLRPGERRPVAAYDQDKLAAARRYDRMPLAGGLWSLGQSSSQFVAAWSAAPSTAVLVHPEAGELGMVAVVRQVAHDTVHHRFDVERSR